MSVSIVQPEFDCYIFKALATRPIQEILDSPRHPFWHTEEIQMLIDHEQIIIDKILPEYRKIPHECDQFGQCILCVWCVGISGRILVMVLYHPFLEPAARKEPHIGGESFLFSIQDLDRTDLDDGAFPFFHGHFFRKPVAAELQVDAHIIVVGCQIHLSLTSSPLAAVVMSFTNPLRYASGRHLSSESVMSLKFNSSTILLWEM